MIVFYRDNERLSNGDPVIHMIKNSNIPTIAVNRGNKYVNPIVKIINPKLEAYVSISPHGDVFYYRKNRYTGLIKLVNNYKFTNRGMRARFKPDEGMKDIAKELLSDMANPMVINSILNGVNINTPTNIESTGLFSNINLSGLRKPTENELREAYKLKIKHIRKKGICPFTNEKCDLNDPNLEFDDGKLLKDTIMSPNIDTCGMGVKFKSKKFNPSTDTATLTKHEGDYLDFPPCETMREFRKKLLVNNKSKRRPIKKPIKRCTCKKKIGR